MIQNLSRLPCGGFLCYGCSLSVLDKFISPPFQSHLRLPHCCPGGQHAPRCRTWGSSVSTLSLLFPLVHLPFLRHPHPSGLGCFYREFSALQPLSDVGGERVLPVLDSASDREALASSSISPLFINLSRCLGRKGQSNNRGLNSPCPAQKGPESVCFLSLL